MVPADAQNLILAGHTVYFVPDNDRCFKDEEYLSVGCIEITEAASFQTQKNTVLLGVKYRDGSEDLAVFIDHPDQLSERYAISGNEIRFYHAYTDDPDGAIYRDRFREGILENKPLYMKDNSWEPQGTKLQLATSFLGALDLCYLPNPNKLGTNLVKIFSKYAGINGVALSLMIYNQRLKNSQENLSFPRNIVTEEALVAYLKKEAAFSMSDTPKILILGGNGGCGEGACSFLTALGFEYTVWNRADINDDIWQSVNDYDIILPMYNTNGLGYPIIPERSNGRPQVRIDVASFPDKNHFLGVKKPTSITKPSPQIGGVDYVAVDNLPSCFTARDASAEFSAAFLSVLLEVGEALNSPFPYVPLSILEAHQRTMSAVDALVTHQQHPDKIDLETVLSPDCLTPIFPQRQAEYLNALLSGQQRA